MVLIRGFFLATDFISALIGEKKYAQENEIQEREIIWL